MEEKYLTGLIRKFADKTASPEELQELQDWYQSIHTVERVEWPVDDPAEPGALQQRMLKDLERRLRDAGAGSAEGIDSPGPNDAPETGTRIALPRIYHRPWVRVAAAVILIAAAWMIIRPFRRSAPEYISIHNPSGKIQRIDLPDHSQVWLNAASSLRYARTFTDQRELFLEGEGYFDVAQDKAHPFVVHAGALTTTVLGTVFDIKSFNDERSDAITVIRGKVQVDNEGKVLDVLTPARQLQWDNHDRTSRTLSVDTNQVTAWQQGKLKYLGQNMEEVAASLGRWYNIRFEFKDSAVRKCRLYANFDTTQPLKAVLDAISLVIDMQFTIDRKKGLVTLTGKGCP